MTIDGVVIRENEINADEPEILNYIKLIRENAAKTGQLVSLNIKKADAEKVELDYCIKHTGFERIRRITGYLVGTIDRWNNAKRAEEKERVKYE